MREVNVGSASDFADPGRKIVGFEGFEVAVFKLDGKFFAYLNLCVRTWADQSARAR